MTAAQFRGSSNWKRARAAAIFRVRSGPRSKQVCALCSRALRFDAGPRDLARPTVDHIRELDSLDLSTAEGRRAAVDPSNLRIVCVSCNCRRGAEYALAKHGRVWGYGRVWRAPRPPRPPQGGVEFSREW